MKKNAINHDSNIPSSGSSMSANNDSNSLSTKFAIKSQGTITFPRNHSSKANFIRISPDAPPAQVKELIFRSHQHKRPSLVISVIGTVKAYSMQSIFFRIFRQGFIKVAKTADVWIITDAVNTCVSKLMGKIVRTNPEPSYPMHLIGFARSKYVFSAEQLQDAHGTNIVYSKSRDEEKNKKLLEPNHTDFIFIDDDDDATNNDHGGNIPFRGLFEKAFLEESLQMNNQIPVVLVVIKGGLEDIKKVHESVIKHRIPVVILDGSGGCCDLFARCYRLYNKYHSKLEKGEDSLTNDVELKNKLRENFHIIYHQCSKDIRLHLPNPNDEADYFELIYQCIETRNLFFNFIDLTIRHHVKSDVDLVILQSFFNLRTTNDLSTMNNEQKREQLNFAFEWQRIDIVKRFIIEDNRDWKLFGLNEIFERALVQNQIPFIQLFLDYDFPLDELFDKNHKILRLYEHENYRLKHIYDDPLRGIYDEIIQPLIGSQFQVDEIFKLKEVDVEKELFVWSILTDKYELALLFWAKGKNKVCAALFAKLLYKIKAREEKNSRYIKYADEFENLAVEILENFDGKCPSECTQAIIRENPQFGNITWLHLAVMAEAKLFIAQRAVQNILQNIWYGHIDHQVGNLKILVSSLTLWYSGFLTYREELVEESSLPRNHVNGTSDSVCSKLMDELMNEEENSMVVVDTNPRQRNKFDVIQYLKNISLFLHAPCVKYLYNFYSHVIFLMLFSYVILCDFVPLYDFERRSNTSEFNDRNRSISNITKYESPNQPRISEIILVVWIFTLFCEEIRQIMSTEVQSMRGKLVIYFAVFWNQLEALAILIFFIAFILRWLPCSSCFSAARILLAIDLSFWYIRTLQMFSAIKRLGPKLVMINEMIHDMKFYMTMITVFVLAYGVPVYSLLHGVEKFTWRLPRTIINLAYWQIFGELEALGDIEKNYEINGYIVFILLIVYMTISSVLLINLLIAMFSNTFDRLHIDTNCIWKFQRYSLVCYHLQRPLFPPPLVMFSHIYRLIIYVFSHKFHMKWFNEIYTQCNNRSKFSKSIADKILIKKIETIEDVLGNDVYFSLLKRDQQQMPRLNDSNTERIHSSQEIVLNKIKMLENQQENMFEYLEYLINAVEKISGDDIQMPKQSRLDL